MSKFVCRARFMCRFFYVNKNDSAPDKTERCISLLLNAGV